VVIEEKDEVLSVPKLNKFGFTSTKIPPSCIDDEEDDEILVPKLKKFGFSKL
jgi:hypothetical protein